MNHSKRSKDAMSDESEGYASAKEEEDEDGEEIAAEIQKVGNRPEK